MTSLKEQGLDIEPMWLQDTTGSMNFKAAPTSGVKRRDVIHEAMAIVVERLGSEDAQAGKPGDEGGLRLVTFADGRASDMGDVNPGNFAHVWGDLRWEGGTQIMPGYNKCIQIFNHEFPDVNNRPVLALLTVLDGEADDINAFERALSAAKGSVYACIGIVGYGNEHDTAYEAFNAIAQTNPHIRVISLESQTDPEAVASALLGMLA